MPGIVVVTYNSADVIDGCLDACLRVPSASIVVVDNASSDGTVDRVRRRLGVELIANKTNRGFAAAVNQGFAALEDEQAILILNPDCAPLVGIADLEGAVLSEEVGAATGRLIGLDGEEQHGFNVRSLPSSTTLAFEVLGLNRIWPGNPVNRRYRTAAPDRPGHVEQPAAAFLMVRRAAWAALGGFDESFFPIWFEDVDFCKRLHDTGLKIVFLPGSTARHEGGHSASKLPWGARQLFWYGSLLRYASKHMSAGPRYVVGLSVILACFPRTVAGMLQFGVAEPVSVYSKVVRLAGQFLRKGERGSSTSGKNQPVKEQFEQSKQSR
jgi:GT2 family glycosyltransferase